MSVMKRLAPADRGRCLQRLRSPAPQSRGDRPHLRQSGISEVQGAPVPAGLSYVRPPIEERKAALAKLLRRPSDGIALNEHYTGDGAIIYKHACALGCEGIVSKRLGSPYRPGRADCWIKVKNPAAPAVTRKVEEEWN